MKHLYIILSFLTLQLYSQSPQKIKVAKEREICNAAILKRNGSNITKAELQNCDSVFIRENCNYKIVSFVVTCCFKGRLIEQRVNGAYFPPGVKTNFDLLEPGNRFFIEEIKIMDAQGKLYSLPDLVFKISQYP